MRLLASRAAARGGAALASFDVRHARAWIRESAPGLWFALVAMAISTGAAAAVLRLWDADLRVPFVYGGDELFYEMVVKSILDHGWYQQNPSLGAPFGQELYDFPQSGSNLHLVVIKALGVFSSDAALVMNVFFLLTFPLTALTAFLVLRRLGISSGPAVVCSAVFALIPYHFVRTEGHLLLAAYYDVPLAAYLILSVLAGQPLFERRAGARNGLLAYASWRSLATLVICAVVASGNTYYAVFTLILLAAATALTFLVRRGMRTLVTGGVVVLAVAGVFALNQAPTVLYRLENGANPLAAKRNRSESDVNSLRLVHLVLPVDSHRLKPLADVKNRYAAGPPPGVGEGANEPLGLTATVGLVWLLIVALAACVGGRRRIGSAVSRHAAVATLLAFLVATTGGVSTLIAYFITPQLRGWNRISVFIAFFSLLAVALLLDRLGRRLRGGAARRGAFAAILAGIFLFAVFDQTAEHFAPDYDAVAAEYRNDAAFVGAVEGRLPPGAAVYQLPYLPFPNASPMHQMLAHDPLRGYLHSQRLRWSYGAMMARPEDWQNKLIFQPRPLRLVLPALAAVGFDGLYVDRNGYADRAQRLEQRLRDVLGAQPLVSADQRFSFFDLREYGRSLASRHTEAELERLRRATLYPLDVGGGEGFFPSEGTGMPDASAPEGFIQVPWRWASRPSFALELVNPSQTVRTATFQTVAQAAAGGRARLLVRYPDGSSQRLRVSRSGTAIRHRVRLRPGTNVVRLTFQGDGVVDELGRLVYVRLIAPTLVDEAFSPFGRLPALPGCESPLPATSCATTTFA